MEPFETSRTGVHEPGIELLGDASAGCWRDILTPRRARRATMLVAIYYLPGDPWPKAFLALGTLFLTTSSFTLATCVRDAQETQHVVSRLDQARVERILADHDPWKDTA